MLQHKEADRAYDRRLRRCLIMYFSPETSTPSGCTTHSPCLAITKNGRQTSLECEVPASSTLFPSSNNHFPNSSLSTLRFMFALQGTRGPMKNASPKLDSLIDQSSHPVEFLIVACRHVMIFLLLDVPHVLDKTSCLQIKRHNSCTPDSAAVRKTGHYTLIKASGTLAVPSSRTLT